jgi:cilia- and flagella-associated protein 57
VIVLILLVFLSCEGEKATITIYDLHSLRKRKILSSPDVQSDEYVSLAFSPDSKYLAAQSGSPDWTLHYWSWEKAKVMASTKTSNQQNSAIINQVRSLSNQPAVYFPVLLHNSLDR